MGKRLRRLEEKASCLLDHLRCPHKEKLRDRQAHRFQVPRLSSKFMLTCFEALSNLLMFFDQRKFFGARYERELRY
jgi:hypothetical protein